MSADTGDLLIRMYELLATAEYLPDNATKVATLEEAVRLADLLNDEDEACVARNELARAAIFAGQERTALVAFAWVLGYVDQHPDDFDMSTLLWNYKLIAGTLSEFSTISRAQIEQSLDDLERRSLAAGGTLHAVRVLRWKVAREMGELSRGPELIELFQKTPRDENSDCHACVIDSISKSYGELGNDKKALTAAKPILQGELTCGEVPRRTYSHLLEPLRRLGELEQAAEYQRKAYRILKRYPAQLTEVSQHVQFLALTGKLAVALRKVLHHYPHLQHKPHQLDRLNFSTAAWLLFERFARRKDNTVRGSALDFPGCQDGMIQVATARDWFWQDGEKLAREFDERNGNSYYMTDLQKVRQLAEQD